METHSAHTSPSIMTPEVRRISGWATPLAVCTAVFSFAPPPASAASLPSMPIAQTDKSLCGTVPLVDGHNGFACDFILKRSNEPAQPMTSDKTKAAFRLQWQTALYQTLVIRIEVLSSEDAELHAYALLSRADDPPFASVHTWLRPNEIKRLIDSFDQHKFWSMDSTHGYQSVVDLPDGGQEVRVCSDPGSLILEGFAGDRAHGIVLDDCQFAQPDKRAFALAKVMTRIAKTHFPDLPTLHFLGH